ncbi:DCC1-like thiol-disulfide oxidoreductase family protein [Gramella sp. GC03-9]|uniref:DCC1-like thiol-disulfide oxidoreductase family protein n=1 Tax=Christiangramia oceanisediminis TaxID=2920386 RepID=A0A9X2KWT2_9FLAO|nr:DCC1-like thiol-disulfide oxidoreductase family protein [Gramella oceanisediminis]MCP9199874.1 DCC1-like thiol-disulfide oxidoreductase family protein [Gramella oceanisediminis]
MFKKFEYTENPPSEDTMIWDGKCGFCKFWKTRWEVKTKGILKFETYQDAAHKFPDIPLKEFKKASRLIETDGKVYDGPDSAYRSLWHTGTKRWHQYYNSSSLFRKMSDHAYNHIAKNRSFYFSVTKMMFGKDPLNFKPYWLLYLVIFALILWWL